MIKIGDKVKIKVFQQTDCEEIKNLKGKVLEVKSFAYLGGCNVWNEDKTDSWFFNFHELELVEKGEL